MARTRASLAAESEGAASPVPVGPPPAKRTRGRPSEVVAESRATSSVPTPATSVSGGSEYQTPLTSNVTTPTPFDASNPSGSKRGKRIEVVLPSSRAVNSRSRLQNSIYAMGSKRKRDVIDDSEDDDSDSGPDAKLARRLQEEEDEAAAHLLAKSTKPQAGPSRRIGLSRNLKARADLIVKEYNPDNSSTSSGAAGKRGGRSTATYVSAKAKGKQPATVIADTEDDDESELSDLSELSDMSLLADEYSSDEEDEPLSQRRRIFKTPARPIRRKTAQGSIDVGGGDLSLDSDDDSFSESDTEASDAESAQEDNAVDETATRAALRAATRGRRGYRDLRSKKRVRKDRDRLEKHHPELLTMWTNLENMPVLKAGKADQPKSISRQLKPFQLEGLAWMKEMEQKTDWKGGLLGDEMGLGKTIQAVSLIMSDWPAKKPTLVLVPPVALMQWMTEIESYTDGTLKTLVFHGTNSKTKNLTVKDVKKYDVIIMSYNSLESMYRRQEKGHKRKDGIYKEKSVIHQTDFHRAILDEAHSIKTRTTMTAKACFALKVTYRWCLTGTPLQNRIGEFFSLIRFLNIRPFASYLCKHCPCSKLEWNMGDDGRCTECGHGGMQHVSVFNQELLNPIQKFGNRGKGKEAFGKLRIMTDRIMLRRLKKDHTNAMELPVKEINVERQFFGEEENDFANSIMTNGQRRFDTYVSTGVLLNNYANIFGLIMQMRQVADHPDLILKKNSEGGQNILVCSICDEPAEDAIRSRCKHDFCRACAKSYLHSSTDLDCPQCHIPLSIDLEQPEIEQDETLVKKSSIINRIKMENWTSSSKIELLVHELHKLRSDHASHKSIIFSQFTTMLQLIEWRLRRAGITTVMLDGSMTPAQRQASIEHFMKNPNVECFLVSLKAGGVALNLTEASQVFIVDPLVPLRLPT
ncbi:SNF2 family N-terminal domain-containing protein [Echria macrotheca]|uniref:SNF2 family N-terminal domain-containing protein n=1 Tax=Echria macrotheca TaxID=438768 RepID=A0AAJ0BMT2_9PEZI|nr:SNF2 family N-terminal domain-containing protein [Echria macrotheca]